MRIVTFNLWHGLAPASPVAFEALEPAGRRQLREQRQVELLRELQPDVCFFQEANPGARRAEELARALDMEFALQPDLVGLKLFGLGIPFNLNSGLVTLVKKSLGIRDSRGISLTRPGSHWVHTWASYQVKEERFALFAESMIPELGRVLLINTHLHHGLEPTVDFLAELDRVAGGLELPSSVLGEIKKRLQAGPERRAQELGVLLENLNREEKRFSAVVLAGDLNSRPESEVGNQLRSLGFRDVWAEAHPTEHGFTFDSSRNQANHLLQASFPLTLVVEDLSFSPKVRDALMAVARKQEDQPRRIDYIWVKSPAPLAIKHVELAGLPDKEGLAPSDHFAVCADLDVG